MANPKENKKSNSKSKKEVDYPEIRLKFHKDNPLYKKIVAKSKKELRSPAKEVTIFLQKKYK